MSPRRPLARFAALAAAFAAAVACSSSGSSGPAPGPVARFTLSAEGAPPFLDVPFPSDAYLDHGRVIDPIPGFDRVFPKNASFLTHELGTMSGFGRTTFAFFYVDDAGEPPTDSGEIGWSKIDPASLPIDERACVADGSAVFLVDLEASDAAHARVPCRAAFHDDSPFLSQARPVLAVGPARGVVLAPAHRYAAVVTSRVRDKAGHALRPSDALDAIAKGSREGTIPALYGQALDRVASLLAPALADGTRVVAIAPYTTHDQTRDLVSLRDTLEDLPVPRLAWDAPSLAPMAAARFARVAPGGALPQGFTASLDDWFGVVDPAAKLPDGHDDPDLDLPVRAHDAIAAVGTAVFDAPNFLRHTTGYLDPVHGTFARGAAGKIVPAPGEETAKIWVTIAVPTAPMPAGGYPAVIVQHGLSGSREYLMSLANTMCARGWMAVAIDSVTFGARAPEASFRVDQHTDYEGAPGAKYVGADGLADFIPPGGRNGPTDFFGGMLNIGAFRDQMRQAEIDTASLVRVLASDPDLAPLATGATTPHIDPTKIAYVGDSLGAVEGTAAAAIEPHVAAWALNVDGGAVILEVANHAPNLGMVLGAGGSLGFGINFDHLSESHPMINVVETIIEPADPVTLAPYLVGSPAPFRGQPTRPRNYVQIEALFDETLANEGSEALARAAGIGLAVPNVGSNAGIRDLKHLENNPGRVPLADVPPGADGTIHDAPVAGTTAVVVQVGPAEHGSDLVRGKGKRKNRIPYALWDTSQPFSAIPEEKSFTVREPYRELQTMVTGFFDDAFAGQVPRVRGFKPPVRDFDDDGATDDVDADPNDPTVQ